MSEVKQVQIFMKRDNETRRIWTWTNESNEKIIKMFREMAYINKYGKLWIKVNGNKIYSRERERIPRKQKELGE